MNVPFLSFEWIIFHFNGLYSLVLNLIISLVTYMAITKHFKNNLIFLKKAFKMCRDKLNLLKIWPACYLINSDSSECVTTFPCSLPTACPNDNEGKLQ